MALKTRSTCASLTSLTDTLFLIVYYNHCLLFLNTKLLENVNYLFLHHLATAKKIIFKMANQRYITYGVSRVANTLEWQIHLLQYPIIYLC